MTRVTRSKGPVPQSAVATTFWKLGWEPSLVMRALSQRVRVRGATVVSACAEPSVSTVVSAAEPSVSTVVSAVASVVLAVVLVASLVSPQAARSRKGRTSRRRMSGSAGSGWACKDGASMAAWQGWRRAMPCFGAGQKFAPIGKRGRRSDLTAAPLQKSADPSATTRCRRR